ncbi:DNA polymerase III subunit alpha [Bacillus sp. AGMB 02131]|uniref:DNA polymerase III subunit alpha n=1 Tax=Peribacillus faecalis TaxID=2772559 RepID=A0A927HBE0_9BACI|nr:DNA polymerase III subunit alpha [Peribacillus faecalis]MBD3109640.1 DNA polymerase III subunit alpha [Peribacillus faecalis]
MDFVHLQVQSAYSLLASTVRIEQLVAEAKAKGMRSLALTDRNVMYGAIPFYKACKQQGIKPIIGLLADVLHGEETYPILLLARNNKGYSNLLKISSSIQTKTKEGLPLKWLKGYSEGLFGISPGEEGIVERKLLRGEIEEAEEAIRIFQAIFSQENFYLSIQNNGTNEYEKLEELAKRVNASLVATNSVCYLKPEDAVAYEVLKAVEQGVKIYHDLKGESVNKERYLKSGAEMEMLFPDHPEALQNTVKIASSCHIEIAMHQNLLPKYPSEIPAEQLLEQICLEGFKERYGTGNTDFMDRLRYELSVIKKMNFSDYFLIVWDFMKFARKERILTGPGRGSAAGSMVAYVLRITDVDPMEHHLLFERFLNPERVTMPDIDIDFSDIRRDEVIAYVAEKYGELHVAQIITFGTFAAKASLRDTGRVFGLNTKELDRLSKMVPPRLGITIEESLKESRLLSQYYNESEKNKLLIDTAMAIEGLPRHTSTHAAGVVICDTPLTETIAIQEGHNGIHLTQFPMETLEELGLLKMDFLGLRNLSLMERVLNAVKKTNSGKNFDIKHIPMQDPKTLAMLGKGDTNGIFQFESDGMKNVLKRLKPERFDDLVTVNALYRPGPMENIPIYIKRRHGEEAVRYLHPDLKPILESTYGIIVYQEQIIQIASKFAGFSLGQADLLRRAVSKKKANVLEEQRKHFVDGCIRQGYENQVANSIYDYIVKFANYGFNLSHAVAYSMIAYQLAYLKAHYPQYFMASLMSSVIGNDTKLAQYVRDLKRMNITLLPPSINKSGYAFQSEVSGIRYSLAAIKGVGGVAVKDIMQARNLERFKDLFDFCLRTSAKAINRKTLEALVYSGAFDEWGEDRATLLASLDVAIDFADIASADADLFHNSEFNLTPKYVETEPIPLEMKLQYEKEVLGLYLSSHPIASYKQLFAEFAAQQLYQAIEEKDGKFAFGVYVTEMKTIRTKKGEVMAFIKIADESDEMEAVAFPNVYRQYGVHLQKGNILFVQGHSETRNGKKQFIIQEVFTIEQLHSIKEQWKQTIYIRVTKSMHTKEHYGQIKSLLHKYPGNVRVKMFFEQTNKAVLMPMRNWVNPSPVFLQSMRKLVGEINLIIKNI